MRQAMAEAPVGDDVYEDDPTINRLQERAAPLMGKEAGLFVPSGTMSNAIAIKVHTKPGDEILLDGEAHSMLYEVGLPATIAHVLTRQFHSREGVPDVDEIAGSLHQESLHGSGTTLLVLENTHNRAGGYIVPLDVHRHLWQWAQEHDVKLHLDGARLFNAAVASGVSAREYAACTDSLTFCLSKGLGCPVGSVLCGTQEFIERARRVRKMLGGGMRQAGILAAAGLYALDNNIERLADDHSNARRLAQGMQICPASRLDTLDVPTNMVYFTTAAPAAQVEITSGGAAQDSVQPDRPEPHPLGHAPGRGRGGYRPRHRCALHVARTVDHEPYIAEFPSEEKDRNPCGGFDLPVFAASRTCNAIVSLRQTRLILVFCGADGLLDAALQQGVSSGARLPSSRPGTAGRQNGLLFDGRDGRRFLGVDDVARAVAMRDDAAQGAHERQYVCGSICWQA